MPLAPPYCYLAAALTTTTPGAISVGPNRKNDSRGSGGPTGRIPILPLQAAAATDLQAELDSEGLGLCHGILHASGVRRLADMKGLTTDQMTSMGVDSFDRREMNRVITNLNKAYLSPRDDRHDNEEEDSTASAVVVLCTDAAKNGAEQFDRVPSSNHDFLIEAINTEHNIFKGRLFTEEQSKQIIRMAEYAAYGSIGTIGAGWGNEIYTLTAQHMPCRDIPGFLATTQDIFDDLLEEMHTLFPEQIRKNSICYESDSEPHLVKYSGKAPRGTELHTDNSKQLCITVNVVLSSAENADFHGGGTYITVLDETILLKQGEMLIHLGDLEHAGAEITSGVRHVLIAFLACEWEKDDLQEVL